MAIERSYRCRCCGETFMTVRGSFCSNACKQKEYRQRKKKAKKAKQNTIRMEVLIEANKLVERLPKLRQGYCSQILLDRLEACADDKDRHSVLNLLNSFMMVQED